jgi:hypothetical protein
MRMRTIGEEPEKDELIVWGRLLSTGFLKSHGSSGTNGKLVLSWAGTNGELVRIVDYIVVRIVDWNPRCR